ncbi:MAG: Response regulator [Bacteriovoracaceae bacterium]|nr:Response regulator [Bacteriovoracaceae bacterium]
MILLVDDNHDLAIAFQLILKSRGYQVVALNSGQEAIDYLKVSETPELILLDYSMPEMNGDEFLQIVQSEIPEILNRTKIVGLSSFSAQDPSLAHFRNLVAGFAEKPYDIESFITLVKQFIA